MLFFTIHNPIYGINKNDFKVINDLIEEENVDEAFKQLKMAPAESETAAPVIFSV